MDIHLMRTVTAVMISTLVTFLPAPQTAADSLDENTSINVAEPLSTLLADGFMSTESPHLSQVIIGSSRDTENNIRNDRIINASIPAQNAPRTDLKAEAEKLVTRRFGGSQFESFSHIVDHESSWSPSATEPSTGAYGLGQALPASKMSPYGSDYLTNPTTQLRWMVEYISERYGTPNVAWEFWQRNHWY
jgi:hypothetical protein